MPRFYPRILPPDWQIARRDGKHWLQQRTDAGLWRDVGGPYVAYHSAVERYERLQRQGKGGEPRPV